MKRFFSFLGLILSFSTIARFSSAADVFIYRNQSNAEALTLSDVRNILDLKHLSWKSGKTITLLVPDLNHIDNETLENFTAVTKGRLLDRWRVKFFSGRARMPMQIRSDEEAIRALQENRDAIYFSFRPLSIQGGSNGIIENKFTY